LPQQSNTEKTYNAIVKSVRDFWFNNKFSGAILGLSGGIDSVLVATILVDALNTNGKNNVIAVSMPSEYTSSDSSNIINELIDNLNIKLINIPINDYITTYENTLGKVIDFAQNNVAENIQARVRGSILMALANHYKGYMLSNTSNKSETAIGYSTLYGDLIGGFAPIKDLYKKDVFALATYRNSKDFRLFGEKVHKTNVIPSLAITRKPTAELRAEQFDEKDLMPYEILDGILFNIIENNLSYTELTKLFDTTLVNKVLSLLKNSEYKRRQGPLGVKLKSKAFGTGMRYTIANNFTLNNTDTTK
jgi:NAD+ synthase (glutamine-hydrolysing)